LFTQSEYLVANAPAPRSTIVIKDEGKENDKRHHDNQVVFGKSLI